ncbi:MAG: FecR domain-containing protein [Rubrivivax sp.]|nr:FecR domain-containing protein [Rubrivivax sp.]
MPERIAPAPRAPGSRVIATALLAVLGATWFAAGAAAQRPAEDDWLHTIEPGDTLIGLRDRLMRPAADWRVVQRLNRVADPRRLMPGRTLRIPAALLREEAATAEVLHVHGEVWVQRAGAAREALAAAAPLRAGDIVGTGAQSSVSLRFVDGSRTQLGPDGRLVVERHVRLGAAAGGGERVETRVRLEAGPAEAHVPPPPPSPRGRPAPQRFEMRTPVVNLGVRGTDFRSRVDGERTWAEVLEGHVAAGTQALEAGQGTVATVAGVAPARPLLPAPDLAALPGRIERMPLQFALPPLEGAGAGARAWRVQVLAPGDVPRLVLESLFSEPRAAWTDDLPDGGYELRVRGRDADGIEGQAARHAFTLKARPEPPFLLRPRAGEKVLDEQVPFAWARNPQAASYRLQVAPSADFAAPSVQRDDLAGPEARVALPLGTHHWRVASVRANGDVGPWGDAQVLERVAQPPPPPPPAAPGSQRARAAGEGVAVNWAAAPLSGVSYQVQISRDAAFTDIVLDERTERTEALLARPDPGLYHVRVRTIGADGRAGAFGAPQEIEVPRSWWWLWLLPLLLLF